MSGFYPVTADKDASVTEEEKDSLLFDEASFRRAQLVTLSAIEKQLCLLNARFEEAFETTIEDWDIT